MKPEEQRIAIAKACGFTIESDGITHCLTSCDFSGNYNPEGKLLKKVPDYLNDLNAMHEAEMRLKAEDHLAYKCYCSNLYGEYDVFSVGEYGNIVSLTAAQRAEEFLHTIGKWV